MLLSELKETLTQTDTITVRLPGGKSVPAHFHLTEIGLITRDYIDCGGKARKEQVINLQLWSSYDYHHRLKADKLESIISMAEEKLKPGDLPVEVEFQTQTIGRYDLEYTHGEYQLVPKETACLASDACMPAVKAAENEPAGAGKCIPGGSCC